MAIAPDQTNVGSGFDAGSTSLLAIVTTNAVAAGGMIFIGAVANATTVSSASGGGITWVVDATGATTGAFTSLIRGYAASGLAGGSTINVTFGANDTGKLAVVSSFTGIDSVSPLDTVGTSTTAGTQAWASTSMTPQAGGISVAATGYWSSGGVSDGGTNTTTAPSVELNNRRTLNTDDEVVLSYRASTGTIAGAFTTSATTWNCAIATYKAAAAATFIPRPELRVMQAVNRAGAR